MSSSFPLSSYITYEELQWITNHVSSFSTLNKGLLPTNLSLRGTIAKCTERCCHKHNNGPTAEMNGVPLYSRLWVACKPPALVLCEAVSLSGIHMLTGHNCRFCCEKKGRLWSSHLFRFSLFFYYQRQQRWKITGVPSQLPFVTLTKSFTLVLILQKLSSGLKQRSNCLFFPGTVIPLKLFPLVWLGWVVHRGIVLC